MLYALAIVSAAVGNHAVSVCDTGFFSDLGDLRKNFSGNIGVVGVYLVKGSDMLFRDHDNVNRCLRVYVVERKDILVLVDLGGGYFAVDYHTEDAVHYFILSIKKSTEIISPNAVFVNDIQQKKHHLLTYTPKNAILTYEKEGYIMKKFIVFSDIHGDIASFHKIKVLAEQTDGVFFAGDGHAMAKNMTAPELYAVGGNCDLSGTPELISEIDGVKILLTHGHRYGVKSSLLSLSLRAKELGCDLAIFGHTHEPFCSIENGVFLLNPGASSGWGRKTYALLTVDSGKITADVKTL